ncbi:hypothetical protein ACFSHP_22340 [Novosphingobium panipatense]
MIFAALPPEDTQLSAPRSAGGYPAFILHSGIFGLAGVCIHVRNLRLCVGLLAGLRLAGGVFAAALVVTSASELS